MQKRWQRENGFTLVELMVTLSLLGLVISGALSLYFFADRSFVSGTIKSDIHLDMQFAMRRITEELRIAHRVEFASNVPQVKDLAEDDHYIFVQDGLVMLRTKHGTQILTSQNPEIANYELVFDSSFDEKGHLLADTISVGLRSINPSVPYSLESHVQALNLRLDGIVGKSPSTVLYFTKTFSPEEIEEGENIKRRCFLATVTFDPQDPEVKTLRRFRDDYLAKSQIGTAIIRYYDQFSPSIATLLEQWALARFGSRILMKPIAFFLNALMSTPFLFIVLFSAGLVLIKLFLNYKGIIRRSRQLA